MSAMDLTGQKFGKLTVMKCAGKDEKGCCLWECKCDCGNIAIKKGKLLRNGHTKSCGCAHKAKNLVGMKFGCLTVIQKTRRKNRTNLWLCKCACGNMVECYQYNLERGTSTSCGCLRSFYAKKTRKLQGKSTGAFYKKWFSIKTRCYNTNSPSYKNYGGRGIKMCDDWLDFLKFEEWSLDNGYSDGLTLERIDVNGNYCPENCKWISMAEQQSNKRTSVFIEYNGYKKTISQWAKEVGISKEALLYRYNAGWTADECLFGKKSKGKHQLPRIEIPKYLKNKTE